MSLQLNGWLGKGRYWRTKVEHVYLINRPNTWLDICTSGVDKQNTNLQTQLYYVTKTFQLNYPAQTRSFAGRKNDLVPYCTCPLQMIQSASEN